MLNFNKGNMSWPKMTAGSPKKLLIGFIIFFIGFTAFGFFDLPPFAKSLLTKRLSQTLQREVTIRQIIEDAILKPGKLESERISLFESKSLSPEKKEKLKDSRVELKLR